MFAALATACTVTQSPGFGPEENKNNNENTNPEDQQNGEEQPGEEKKPDGKKPVGSACASDSECSGTGAKCLKDPGDFPDGYCVITGCKEGTCPAGSDCYTFSDDSTACLKTCDQKSDCRDKYQCHNVGACVGGCTQADCTNGATCNPTTLQCEAPPPGGGPPVGPGPACPNLPPRDCTGTAAYCMELLPFEPDQGPGYDDYPINGETQANQYRSYARRDLMMLVKYAAAYVDCKAKTWTPGNGMPIGLGDMSESNGAIPGTSINQPGHPAGTHVQGNDMDIAYYQLGTANNYLRPICPHTQGGQDKYHCVSAPTSLDVWRTALFIGAFFTSPQVRVLGVDGQVGTLVEGAMRKLCTDQWLPQAACNSLSKLAYETTDGGAGWYHFHHHHLHISLKRRTSWSPLLESSELVPGERNVSLDHLHGIAGHTHSTVRTIPLTTPR
jgi:hypothetical protein